MKPGLSRYGQMCQVIPCNRPATAVSLCGTPVCLHHGNYLGGYTLLPLVWEYEQQRVEVEQQKVAMYAPRDAQEGNA